MNRALAPRDYYLVHDAQQIRTGLKLLTGGRLNARALS